MVIPENVAEFCHRFDKKKKKRENLRRYSKSEALTGLPVLQQLSCAAGVRSQLHSPGTSRLYVTVLSPEASFHVCR